MANNLRLLVDSRRALAETSWAETSVLFFLFLLFHGSLNLSNVFNMWRTPQKKERWESNTSKHCGANCITTCRIYQNIYGSNLPNSNLWVHHIPAKNHSLPQGNSPCSSFQAFSITGSAASRASNCTRRSSM